MCPQSVACRMQCATLASLRFQYWKKLHTAAFLVVALVVVRIKFRHVRLARWWDTVWAL